MKLLVLCAVLTAATASVVKDDVFGFTITKDTLGKDIYFSKNSISTSLIKKKLMVMFVKI